MTTSPVFTTSIAYDQFTDTITAVSDSEITFAGHGRYIFDNQYEDVSGKLSVFNVGDTISVNFRCMIRQGNAVPEIDYVYWVGLVQSGSSATTVTTTQTTTTTTTSATTTTTTQPPVKVDYDLGDVNNDKKVDSSDASEILAIYAAYSTNNDPHITEAQRKAADVNEDGSVNSSDATLVLAYYSYVSTGGKLSIRDYLKTI